MNVRHGNKFAEQQTQNRVEKTRNQIFAVNSQKISEKLMR